MTVVSLFRKALKYFEDQTVNLPLLDTVHGCEIDPRPYFLVGDEIFPLGWLIKCWLMRPFPGKLTEEKRIFNYR